MMTEANPHDMSDEFIEEIKTALENLYDFPSLQRLSLLQVLPNNAKHGENPVQHLRRLLTEAIESLKPATKVSARTGAGRIYHLLHLHYLAGMVLPEVAQELGLSLRQIYRDLRRGQENISTILWYQFREATQSMVQEGSLESEFSRLDGDFSPVDLGALLALGLKAVQKLSERLAITVSLSLPDDELIISSNAAIAQQVLINLISQTMQQLQPKRLAITVEAGLQIRLVADQDEKGSGIKLDPVIEQLMSQLAWTRQAYHAADTYIQILRLRREGKTIVIIDDNEGLTDLLSRYLPQPNYRCVVAHRGEEGLRVVQELLPDAIIMDLMMPGMDGWELLQRLRTISETRTIPVIICSVINDPELAYSLGASAFVAKPVEKEKLLAVLKDLSL